MIGYLARSIGAILRGNAALREVVTHPDVWVGHAKNLKNGIVGRIEYTIDDTAPTVTGVDTNRHSFRTRAVGTVRRKLTAKASIISAVTNTLGDEFEPRCTLAWSAWIRTQTTKARLIVLHLGMDKINFGEEQWPTGKSGTAAGIVRIKTLIICRNMRAHRERRNCTVQIPIDGTTVRINIADIRAALRILTSWSDRTIRNGESRRTLEGEEGQHIAGFTVKVSTDAEVLSRKCAFALLE